MGNIKVIKPRKDFEMVSGQAILDLDIITLGVYCKLLKSGARWQTSLVQLGKATGLSVKKIRAAVTKMEYLGYMRRVPAKCESGGKFSGWDWEIYGVPCDEDDRTRAGVSESTDLPVTDQHRNGPTPLPTNTVTDQHRNGPTPLPTNTVTDQHRNGQDYNTNLNNTNLDNNNINNNIYIYTQNDFKKLFLEVGVNPETLEQWLKVRRNKRLTNSELAAKAVLKEIAKSGRPAEYCIAKAVEHSWGGFVAAWLAREDSEPSTSDEEARRQRETARAYIDKCYSNEN